MKKKKLLAAVAAIVGFSLCFLGCAADNDDDPPETNLPSANPFAEKTFYGSQTIEGAEYDVCELRFTSETEVTLVQYGKAADGADKTESLTYTVSDGKASVTYNGKTITTSTITDGGTFTASLDGTDEKKCSFSTTQGMKYPGASTDPDTPPANPFAGNTFYGSQTVNEAKYDFCELKFTSETEVTLVQYGKAAGGADKTELLTYTVSGGTASVAYRTTTITTSVIADGTFTLSLDGTDAKTYSFSTEKRSRYIADGMYCSGWLKVENSIVTKCDTAAKGAIEIPKGVTSIGDSAFRYCEDLTSVTIPEGVTSIGSSAFSGCSGLTSVAIPEGVTSIGSSAFSGCSGLTSVAIPASVTSIGNGAFYGCSNLATVEFKGTTAQWATVKKGYGSVTTVTCSDGEADWDYTLTITDGVLTECTGSAGGTVIIPEGVTSIGSEVFKDRSELTSVTIPASVTSIGDSAFSGCSGLTSVTIPAGVTSIGDSAFSGCSGLTSVTIPVGVTSIGDSAFSGCSGLTSVTIPVGVTSIGSSAFSGCSGLTSVTIPEGVTSIGSSAFSGCSGLTSVTIPAGVTSIGNSAFDGCSGLTSVAIPESVTSIGYKAFQYCSGLTSVTIPASVKYIGSYAFQYCSGLTSVTIPASVTSIGDGAFYYLCDLATVEFKGTTAQWATVKKGYGPVETVTCTDGTADWDYTLTITDGVLTKCTGSAEGTVIVPESVTSIREGAFKNCNNVTSIKIGSIESIEKNAFSGCSVKSIEIESITSIKTEMFSGCTKLSVKIGSIESIEDSALIECNSVKSVEIGSVTSIGRYAFSGCSGLTSVTISEGVTSIGDGAFQYCSSLTSVTIPASVTSIGSSAFSRCSSLTSVTIPASVTSIGSSAFSSCSSLTSVIIPEGVTSIGNYTFSSCSGLTSVTIPASITSIGEYAFNQCSSLVTVNYNGTTAQWAAIEKGRSWSYAVPATTKVTCSGGEQVNLNYTGE